jgi:Transposase DDE domain.
LHFSRFVYDEIPSRPFSAYLKDSSAAEMYPEEIRMVTYEDYATGNVYRFLTNNTEYEAITISKLYRERWNVELFFK